MSRPRLHDDGYLAFLRLQPCCCGCGRQAPSQAAHIRIGFFTMGKKPDDRFAVPLNQWCHLDAPDAQHENERAFWERRRLDPFAIAARFYAEYGGTGGKPRRPRKSKPRLPKERRARFPTRKDFKWPKRPLSRKSKV